MDGIIQTFNNTFKEFLLELKKAFPEEISNDIIDNYNPDKESTLKIVSQITETFSGLSTRISEEDDNIFYEKSIILLSDLDISLIFKNASKINKNVIWKYIQTLFLMSTAINTKKTSVDEMADVFKESLLAALVVIPQTSEQLSKVIEISYRENFYVIPRGGGLSYTDSYLPKKHKIIIATNKQLHNM